MTHRPFPNCEVAKAIRFPSSKRKKMASHMDVDVPSVQYIAEEPASLRADDHNNAQDDDSSSEEENDMDAGETALGPSLSKEEINGLKEQVHGNLELTSC